ncbi:chymotrypsin-like protease CTRL-1, partial [Heptranchias perlo]|uniref:chymotrypsin-like protease CTRL-1 n=1 Tax=Heptranchias perlo TaxID=212740 RepID=UPI003559FECD
THLYFVLDASGSVGKQNFQKTIEFVMEFSEKTSDISGGLRYFAIVFASRVLFERAIEGSAVHTEYFEGLNYTDYLNEMGTNIGGALTRVLESINKTVHSADGNQIPRQIVLLITDGRQNIGPDPSLVVQKIKDTVPDSERNLDIFTIGIGDASKQELERLTTKKEAQHSFYFTSYHLLDELTNLTKLPMGAVKACGIRGRVRDQRSLGRVFGGENAEKKQWPWQVLIQVASQGSSYVGGGSIISPRWILSAAHNFVMDGPVANSQISVYIGRVKRLAIHRKEVAEVHVHDRYNDTATRNNGLYIYDIAVLRLKEDLVYSDRIRPVCLPCTKEVNEFLSMASGDWRDKCRYQDRILTGNGGEEDRDITGYVTGWGKVDDNDRAAFHLQYGKISIKPRDQCRRDDIDETQLCAKGDGVDTCMGDSGGPFAVKFKQRWIQIGITSSGSVGTCDGDNMGYYTNVVRMMEWLRAVVTDLQYN